MERQQSGPIEVSEAQLKYMRTELTRGRVYELGTTNDGELTYTRSTIEIEREKGGNLEVKLNLMPDGNAEIELNLPFVQRKVRIESKINGKVDHFLNLAKELYEMGTLIKPLPLDERDFEAKLGEVEQKIDSFMTREESENISRPKLTFLETLTGKRPYFHVG